MKMTNCFFPFLSRNHIT